MYRVRVGAAFGGVWTMCLVGFVLAFASDTTTSFLHWGPSEAAMFGGMKIDMWVKWALVMIYLVISQIVYSIVSSTLSLYVSNVIRDHKTPRDQKRTYYGAHGIVQLTHYTTGYFPYLVSFYGSLSSFSIFCQLY